MQKQVLGAPCARLVEGAFLLQEGAQARRARELPRVPPRAVGQVQREAAPHRHAADGDAAQGDSSACGARNPWSDDRTRRRR